MHTPEQIETWTAESGLAMVIAMSGHSKLTRFAALVAQHERAKCIYAVDGERLVDTSLPEDAAYERALDHAISAIRALAEQRTGGRE